MLVLVDLLVLAAALCIWLAFRADPDENAVNEGLRGSKPPAGQRAPDLAAIEGITPPVPKLTGMVTALVATCLQCPSGDVIGGFLGRLGDEDLPDGARIVVVAWDGDVDEWRRTWSVPESIDVHTSGSVTTTGVLRRTFGIGERAGNEESGITFLYDRRGRWRSSFFLGQLDREDVLHDLEQLAGE